MPSTLKNPYAKNVNGDVINIVSAKYGEDYFCIGCGEKLLIKDGHVLQKHFSHKSSSDCLGGLETTVHIKGKEAFVKSKSATFRLYGAKNIDLTIESAKEEVTYSVGNKSIVVDVVLQTKELGEVFVEIWNTHKTQSDKISLIKALGVPCIEINVSYFLTALDWDEECFDSESFVRIVTHPNENGKWLNPPQSLSFISDIEANFNAKLIGAISEKQAFIDDMSDEIRKLRFLLAKKEKEICALNDMLARHINGEHPSPVSRNTQIGYAFLNNRKNGLHVYLHKQKIYGVQTKRDKKANEVIPIEIFNSNGNYVVVPNIGSFSKPRT